MRSSFSSSSWRFPSAGACDPRFRPAKFLPLRRTISFSHAFSRRRSVASRSSSSVLPVRSPIVRSRLSVLIFFFTLNRAVSTLWSQKEDLSGVVYTSPEAAVFLRRLSSSMDVASSAPSWSCDVGGVVGDVVGEGVSWEGPALCGTVSRGIDIVGFVG